MTKSAPVDPKAVVPGYETDISAVGTNRRVADDAQDDTPWHDVHELDPADAAKLLEDHSP